MLVFTKLEDLGEINQARIERHLQQEAHDQAARKQRAYQQMADKQIQQVIAAMMSVSDYAEQPSSRSLYVSSDRRKTQQSSDMMNSFISDSANVLKDSQDVAESGEEEGGAGGDEKVFKRHFTQLVNTYASDEPPS